jgi:hypothetical protein
VGRSERIHFFVGDRAGKNLPGLTLAPDKLDVRRQSLCVNGNLRKIGHQLMAQAEACALRRGCQCKI